MKQFTETYSIKLSEIQIKTLKKLKQKYKVNSSKFVREAISEKLQREYKTIIEKEKTVKMPF